MPIKPFSFFLFFVLLTTCVHSQQLTGTVSDRQTREAIPGVAVILLNPADSAQVKATATSPDGTFSLSNIPPGLYILKTSFIGYKNTFRNIRIANENTRLQLEIEQAITQLKDVTVEGAQIRAQQKGDTTEYNADAFKVNPDATTEDLVKKMPGVTVENGVVKAQGEEVRRVLIDGKEFFGDDASMALKNLPAEVVEKIQVFDQMSDQAQFTGFDDGSSRKALNIKTRGGLKNAEFGRFYAGYGTDERYSGGAVYNNFKGNRRLTLLGQSNNVNQQNFSGEDLLGLTAGSGGGGGGGRGGGGGGRGGGGGGGMNRMMGPSANDPSNFMVGQQSGINNTNSLGINYTDSIGKKIRFTGSYFFNNTSNNTDKSLTRDFYLSDTSSRRYRETNEGWSNNLNHRLNLRIEGSFDSLHSFIYTPRISWQGNRNGSLLEGATLRNADSFLNATATENIADNTGYSMGHNLLLRRKFRKAGRTVSLMISSSTQERYTTSGLISENEYAGPTGTEPFPDSLSAFRQGTDAYYNSRVYSGNLTYTEPLGKTGQLFVSYSPQYVAGTSEKYTNRLDPLSGEYIRLDTLLSNYFVKTTEVQRGGAGLRFNTKRLTLMANLNAEQVILTGDQSFPFGQNIRLTFRNLLPMAMLNFKFSNATNLRMFYRTNTNAPHISHLQNVVDNSNPLQLSTGNPNLNQEYSHNLNIRFGTTNVNTARSFFANINTTLTNQYFANSVFLAEQDTVLDGIRLVSGSQLTRPVNLNGNLRTNSLLTYSLPVKLIRSTFSLQGGLNYSLTPGEINNRRNETHNYGYTGGVIVASNVSEKIDFSLSYNGGWNLVNNTLQPQLNNNYVIQNVSFRGNWLPWKGLVLTTDINHSRYDGLNAFNQRFWLWNAGIGYKFLKNRAGELRLSAFDLLKQNTSISRNVTETYVEDSQTRVLTRYLMLTFTWNLRSFNLGNSSSDQGHVPGQPGSFDRPPGPPPGGAPPR